MSSNPFERAASIRLTDSSGEIRTASALIHKDPQYLYANRISLVGARDKELEILGFGQNGVVDWQFYNRPDWKLSDDPDYAHIQRGSGILRLTGMTQGVSISDDSVQQYAEIEIIESVNELHDKSLKTLGAEYWFLQRPTDDWYIRRRSWEKPAPTKLAGQWFKIAALGLRFRLLSITVFRDDERIGAEREHIELPGVEIQALGSLEEETFFSSADRLWFAFRVLLVFRYRQYIHTLAEFKKGEKRRVDTWHSVRLDSRKRRRRHEANDPPFHSNLERYLAKGASKLAQMEPQCQLLHAAAFGYASSYNTFTTESGLTACIEGIERLVEAFEQVNGLTRERIEKPRWRKLGKAVRQKARTVDATRKELAAINDALSGAPMMLLLERIERMVRSLRTSWRLIPLELLDGASAMITARNDIVHGRLLENHNKLQIERMRAQILFERLWLGFLGCGNLADSGWQLLTVRSHSRSL